MDNLYMHAVLFFKMLERLDIIISHTTTHLRPFVWWFLTFDLEHIFIDSKTSCLIDSVILPRSKLNVVLGTVTE